jgi:cytochrome bd-type quinol oxidase subunit 2
VNQAIQVAIYVLCLLASGACAWLLLRGYRRSGTRLLLWTGICFFFLCLNSVAVLFDILILPHHDLQAWRHASSFLAVTVLLFGLVWESE